MLNSDRVRERLREQYSQIPRLLIIGRGGILVLRPAWIGGIPPRPIPHPDLLATGGTIRSGWRHFCRGLMRRIILNISSTHSRLTPRFAIVHALSMGGIVHLLLTEGLADLMGARSLVD
jgi:hypothetical protein